MIINKMAKLKKGSAAAKAWGRKMKRLRNKKTRSKSKKRSKSRSIKYKPRKMVKRKKKRSYKRGMTILGLNLGKAGSAALYGGVREKISNMLAPYTARIPILANVSDEVGMLATLTAVKKWFFKGKGIMRDSCSAGQIVESARIGEAIAKGATGISFGGVANGNGNGVVY